MRKPQDPEKQTDYCAFILAAGEGRRLKPYTDTLPKPMVPVAGTPILGHTIAHLEEAGISKAVINTYYKADIIHHYITEYKGPVDFTISREQSLLNTGLGVKQALSGMHGKPFFVINGDAFWSNGAGGNVFERLENAWQPEKMDILLLVQPVQNMILTHGVGDYVMAADGRLTRQKDLKGDFMFAGIRICKPEIFNDTPDTPFGFLELMDRAESQGRLYGLVHDGQWHHISTPQELEQVNQDLQMKEVREGAA